MLQVSQIFQNLAKVTFLIAFAGEHSTVQSEGEIRAAECHQHNARIQPHLWSGKVAGWQIYIRNGTVSVQVVLRVLIRKCPSGMSNVEIRLGVLICGKKKRTMMCVKSCVTN